MEIALYPEDFFWPSALGLALTLTLVVITLKWDRMHIKRKEQR